MEKVRLIIEFKKGYTTCDNCPFSNEDNICISREKNDLIDSFNCDEWDLTDFKIIGIEK